MTKQIIKDPPTSWDVYGYIEDKKINKRQVILYGQDFDYKENTFTIDVSMLNTKLFLKRPNLIERYYKKEDKEALLFPKFTLIFCDYTNTREIFELHNCTITQFAVNLMPGRRVISCKIKGEFNSLISYKPNYKSFDNEIYNADKYTHKW